MHWQNMGKRSKQRLTKQRKATNINMIQHAGAQPSPRRRSPPRRRSFDDRRRTFDDRRRTFDDRRRSYDDRRRSYDDRRRYIPPAPPPDPCYVSNCATCLMPLGAWRKYSFGLQHDYSLLFVPGICRTFCRCLICSDMLAP